MDIKDLVIYRNLEHQELFRDIAHLMGYAQGGQEPDGASCGGRLTEMAVKYGFEGNLWHCFLAFCLANNENAYTTTCEITGPAGGSLDELAREDCRIFKALFDYDIRNLEPSGLWTLMEDYKPARKDSRVFNRRIRNRIVNLAVQLEESADAGEFQDHVVDFYREFGVGKFGLNKAFRIIEKEEGQPVIIDPIINVEHIYFKDIVGYELQKQKLIENTEAFVEGKEANNVLLFGDAGTGKSSSVKAVLNEYYGRGLRIIEVYKHQFKALSDVLEQIKDRNYKFIIYMDDLSFEEFEIEYKFLKAVIEGGVETKPENILIYATSNRRHLIKETWNDRSDVQVDNGMHKSDTMEEKLSLVHRFGVTINYSKPTQKEYFDIAIELCRRLGVELSDDEIKAEANKWELSHGGISGRTAQQFSNYLAGQQK